MRFDILIYFDIENFYNKKEKWKKQLPFKNIFKCEQKNIQFTIYIHCFVIHIHTDKYIKLFLHSILVYFRLFYIF